MIKKVKKNILSLITALVILFLSFANADSLNRVNVIWFKHLDKVVHMSMYFGLMLALLFENRSALKINKNLFLLAIIPFLYGSLIELLQSWLTATRKGDFIDALFNLVGIFLAMFVWSLFKRFSKYEK